MTLKNINGMKNGQNLGKFHSELVQKFTVLIEIFLDALLSVLTKFPFILLYLGLKSFNSHEYHRYLGYWQLGVTNTAVQRPVC